MAYKKYAYFNKGNKIGVVEKAESTSSGFLAVAHCTLGGYTTKDTCEAAGGQWIPASSGTTHSVGEYKSPIETVTKGLEIEYSYAPVYRLNQAGDNEADAHRFIGWGSDGTNLVLFTYNTVTAYDISSKFTADQWILIKGSGKWSGLHKVKSATDTGILTTYTKCSLPWSKLTNAMVNLELDEEVTTGEATVRFDFDFIKEVETRDNVYIFIDKAEDSPTDGPYKINLYDTDSPDKLGKLTSKYGRNTNTGNWVEAAVTLSEEDDDTLDLYNMVYDEMIVYEEVEVLEDESFELDLTRYQANAVVYYLQAKKFEDAGDVKAYEYYMRRFNKQLEKSSNSRKYGPHIIQGNANMRRR